MALATLETFACFLLYQRLLANRTNQNVKKVLGNHGGILRLPAQTFHTVHSHGKLHPVASGDQLGFTFKAPDRRIWLVRDLVAAVRTHLEREYSDIWVEGEISNFRAHDSGHLYFTLKDQDSQIKAVIFRSQARLLRFRPDNGMQVILRGRVTVFEGRGDLQLSAEYLEPKGAGALQVAFEQLKAKLQAEGVFDPAGSARYS